MRLVFSLLALSLPKLLFAQGPLSADEAVRAALVQSPAVAAARSRLEAASAAVRGAGSPYGLVGEVAPGVAYTNGNALLSQRIDISGRRSADTRQASGEYQAAAAVLEAARVRVAAEARTAYFDLVRARGNHATASEALGIASQIRDAVRRRVELGEAPAVHATRAEIEVGRAEQDVERARGEVEARLSMLNVLLGRPVSTPLSVSDALKAPDEPQSSERLMSQAEKQRFDLQEARARIEAQRGAVDVARAQNRPDLFAEVAADTWSLDRRPWRSSNLGVQMRLTIPLTDGGAQRASVDRARALVKAQEAEYEALRRSISAEVARAAAELGAARKIVLHYQQAVLPRSEELLRVSRSGFESGLTSFVDVLDAQRVHRLIQAEYQAALFDAVRAQIQLERVTGAVPGLPSTAPR